MAKVKTIYKCQQCGGESLKWAGQCSSCNAWNSLVEEIVQKSVGRSQKLGRRQIHSKVVKLKDIQGKKSGIERVTTGSGEFDRVLGGGIVPGSVVLVAGEPGIGKSTLLTQLAMSIGSDPSTARRRTDARRAQDDKPDLRSLSGLSNKGGVLYVSGEESVNQVGMRVERLGRTQRGRATPSSPLLLRGRDNIGLLAETDVDVIIGAIDQEKSGLVVVDSIQTLSTTDLSGMAGSVGQVRESANRLISVAKRLGVAIFVVGHVTKEGSIAGPKVLEHMVDTVLTIEGEKTGLWRILRAYKNRFGPTDEVGVMQMDETGMRDVTNPSGVFLEESQSGQPGSVVIALMEGTRPVLVEVQALAVKSQLAIPRRVSLGVTVNKLQLMCAVLQKHCRLPLGSYDVFVNVAGGLRITEPAADLGIALAIASSVKGKALPKKSVVVGEVGLLGEIRKVTMQKRRISEAKKMGYGGVISPDKHHNLKEAVRKLAV